MLWRRNQAVPEQIIQEKRRLNNKRSSRNKSSSKSPIEVYKAF